MIALKAVYPVRTDLQNDAFDVSMVSLKTIYPARTDLQNDAFDVIRDYQKNNMKKTSLKFSHIECKHDLSPGHLPCKNSPTERCF